MKSKPEIQKKTSDELMAILQRIFEEDQVDGHSRAPVCLSELQSLELDFVRTDCEDPYWDSVSRESLHIAQHAAQSGQIEIAITQIQNAVRAAKKVKGDFYADSDWIAYLEATLAYFHADKEKMHVLVEHCDKNRRVVECLIVGLELHGQPDYQRDY